jgi:hypothetical protein
MKTKNNLEYLEMKKILGQLVTMINMIIPTKVSVSYLAESTNRSRQSVRQYLINNFEPEKDFWNEGGKIYVSKDAAISILQRANNTRIAA